MSEATASLRIYVVDDDASVRNSLSAFLSAHGFDPVAYADGEDFLAGFEPSTALCAFLDVRMPGLSGMEVQAVLTGRGIALPLIILTAHGDVPMAVVAMKHGAIDFIEKPASEMQLLDAIDAAASLRSQRPQAGLHEGVVAERLARLTHREKNVLDHLILGKTSKHIADELGISQRTVEIHRSRIREKMEARGLSDLILMMR
ncbi:MAG: response regulator transcription factor [Rhizobiaceae bacterium]|nr:response regulator transcription factor [Rhizobiaceae bacterium]